MGFRLDSLLIAFSRGLGVCHCGTVLELAGRVEVLSCLLSLPHACVRVQGVRDMVKHWLMSFMEIGGLMKRLDVGEGNYTKELEEDYEVYDAMNQVRVLCVHARACARACLRFIGSLALLGKATGRNRGGGGRGTKG